MNEFILATELPIRLGCFFGLCMLVAALELVLPRRALTVS